MATANDETRARLLALFQMEAEEHLHAMAAHLATLQHGTAPAETESVAEALFREVHTLKGAARSVSIRNIEAVCQAAESLLSRMRRAHCSFTEALCRSLADANDTMTRLLAGTTNLAATDAVIARLEHATADLDATPHAPAATEPVAAQTLPSGASAAPAARAAPALSSPPTQSVRPLDTMRIAVGELDPVLAQMESLLAVKLAAVERAQQARALSGALAACRPLLQRGRGATAPLPVDVEPALHRVATQASELAAHLADDGRRTARTVDTLDGQMRRLAMAQATSIVELFPGMMEDLASERGKLVDWVAEGAQLEVDRRVLDAMKEPLIHLIRNAIDHGIEAPSVRTQAGKSPRGTVALRIRGLEGGRIGIDVADDGAGVNLSAVRAAAVRAGFLTAEAVQQLSDAAILDLIYRSGLSTSAIVTSVSGRGLGLAIVREQVDRLGGRMRIDTRDGKGTTVHLHLPASIATFRGVLVCAGNQQFLLPIDAVERTLQVAADAVRSVEGRDAITYDGHPVPLVQLTALLGLPGRQDAAAPVVRHVCAIVTGDGARVALGVDEILGTPEVVVKQFGPPLVRVPNVAGVGLLGTGQIALTLRPADLLRSAQRAPAPAAPAEAEERRRRPVILVVDDSITTRTMEKNLLEAAGYAVRVAADGVEGWTILKSEDVDLVVSDVDMPRLDGFELTARIRADQQLAELPVVLVTVLESRENKERGIAVGANAYVVKSSFEQSNLLGIIGRLV